MLIAHISDIHIMLPGPEEKGPGGQDTPARLKATVAALNALDPRPDVVIVTGDLVHTGAAAEYACVAGLLADLSSPWHVVPGNKDRRAALLAGLAGKGGPTPAGHFIQYAVEEYPVRLLALDSLDERRNGGHLCAERLAWLETALAEQPGRPTALFLHHPPIRTGLAAFDQEPFLGAGELAEIVGRHANVVRVLTGHLHRPLHAPFAGTMVTTAPSAAFEVALDLRPGAPFAVAPDPTAFWLHAWSPDAGLVSHLAYLNT